MHHLWILLSFISLIICNEFSLVKVKVGRHMKSIGNMQIESCPKYYPEAPCGPYNPTDDIMQLRPSDIGIVAAIGDSVTAAFGANSTKEFYLPQSWIEYRGQSFSIGGDYGAQTLPNFFQHYHVCRNNIVGASKGNRYISFCFGGWCPPSDWLYYPEVDGLNAAVSGAEVDILDKQIKYIIKSIKNLEDDPALEDQVKRGWKLVTVFIGMNDICDGPCDAVFAADGQVGSSSLYEAQLRKAIEDLRLALPRTLVYLVQLFDISDLEEWTSNYGRCSNASWMRNYLCPCTKSPLGRQMMSARFKAYNNILEQVAADYVTFTEVEFSGSEAATKKPVYKQIPIYSDFAVILSKTLSKMDLMNDVPIQFVTEFDCFHPSILGHQSLAVALWNDLFVPSYKKPSKFSYPLNIFCPAQNDTIRVD